MAYKIVIPARVILENKEQPLLFDQPLTCSRCNRTPADYFETHKLKIRAGLRHNPLPGRRYKLNENYTLKIRICQRCYYLDYLLAPENLAGEDTPLGHLASMQNFLRMLGGLSAALGLLMLTPFVPATAQFAAIKASWWIPLAGGVALILLGLYSQVSAQMKVRRALEAAGEFDPNLTRAEVRTPLFASPEDLNQVALEVKLENEPWAQECAELHHWHFEKIEE